MRKLTAVAVTALALAALAACRPGRHPAELATEIPADSALAYVAGRNLMPGTWTFANQAAHPKGEACSWSVFEHDAPNGSDAVASGRDGGNTRQSVYVASGQMLIVANCGAGAWLSLERLPLASATPSPSRSVRLP